MEDGCKYGLWGVMEGAIDRMCFQKGAAPEPINRRVLADSDEEPEEFEVKNLLSKFKNIEQGAGKPETEQKGPKPKRKITPPPEGYR